MKNSNVDIFENALYMKSGSMPLTVFDLVRFYQIDYLGCHLAHDLLPMFIKKKKKICRGFILAHFLQTFVGASRGEVQKFATNGGFFFVLFLFLFSPSEIFTIMPPSYAPLYPWPHLRIRE